MRGSDGAVRSDPAAAAFACPVCGIPLDELDLAVPDEGYLCPLCGTSRKPRVAPARASSTGNPAGRPAGGGDGGWSWES